MHLLYGLSFSSCKLVQCPDPLPAFYIYSIPGIEIPWLNLTAYT